MMNKKGVLETKNIFFSFIIFSVIISAVVFAVSDVAVNYNVNLEDGYQDIFIAIQQNVTDLQGQLTDESQVATGEDVNDDVSAVFKGIKVTGQTFSLSQSIISNIGRLFGFIPGWVWGTILTMAVILIVMAIYSDLRGK